MVTAQQTMYQAERRSDVQQLDPISLECKPEGFRILIPLRTSLIRRAEFWNHGHVPECSSDKNEETSERMLVLTSNYSSCGTLLMEDEESLVFQNVVVVQHPEAADNSNNLIERVEFSMIPVVCNFMRADQFSFLQSTDLQPASVRRMKDPLSGNSTAKVR